MSSLDASYNVVNEVAYAYDGWGNRILERQSHAGPVSEFTPAVHYVFDDGASGGGGRVSPRI